MSSQIKDPVNLVCVHLHDWFIVLDKMQPNSNTMSLISFCNFQEAKAILDGEKLGDTRQDTSAMKQTPKRTDTMLKARDEGSQF